jgi:hypothetical protein
MMMGLFVALFGVTVGGDSNDSGGRFVALFGVTVGGDSNDSGDGSLRFSEWR